MHTISTTTDQYMRLVRILMHFLHTRKDSGRCHPVAGSNRESNIRQQTFRQFNYLLEIHTPHRKEYHIFRCIKTTHKRTARFRIKGQKRSLISQYIMSQRMPVIKQILEFIEDQFRRAVLIRINLIQDHIHFFLYFLLRKL